MERDYLLYDDDCPLCLHFQEWVQRRDRHHIIEPVGFKDARIPKIVPQISAERLQKSFHLVMPDGKVLSGSRAMPTLLGLLPGWKIVGWLLRVLPGANIVSDRIYRWIASHRK